MSVTTDDLLDALREALSKPTDGDASTAYELSKSMKCSVSKVRKLLRSIHEDGRLEMVSVYRTNLAGMTQALPGYRTKS